ncbi:zygote arrest protein 1-like [Pomacea canaliculata]|uniref:zygote arrest protein 1-like n=1 Tax=Pomacea canaliculata TaxID=400727 RepID=UPI000D73CBF9|nr:zygote arrest protein 1-like [Pomacea canaliculata]
MAAFIPCYTGPNQTGLPPKIFFAPPGINPGFRDNDCNEEDYDDYDDNYDDHYNHYEDYDPYDYDDYTAEEEYDPYDYYDYAPEEEDYYDNEDDYYGEENDYYDDEDDFREKRCYGFFKCSSCRQLWESANVYCRVEKDILRPLYQQDCKKCRIGCLPYQVEPLRCSLCGEHQCGCQKRHVDVNKPHRSDLCHRCRAGRPCTQS